MPHKVTFIVKGIPADLATVRGSQTGIPASAPNDRLVIGLVAADVSPQPGTLCESFPADFAAEWHLSIMGFHVSLQRASMAELFVADSAPKWLLCRVDPHVCHHVALLVKAFSADVAAKGFLSGVQPKVCLLSAN